METQSGSAALVLAAVSGLPPGSRVTVDVLGGSMLPTLRDGDRTTVVRCPAEDLRLGDLAVVDLPPFGLVVHRVLWVGRLSVRTRGDGSGTMDPPIPHARVLGRVVSARRDGREVLPGPVGRWAQWAAAFTAAAARHALRRVELAFGRPGGEGNH